MPPHFRIKELRHFPRYPTQVEADTVFRRRQIKFFGHDVYMHYWAKLSKRFLAKIFQRLCRGQKHLKISLSLKAHSNPMRRSLRRSRRCAGAVRRRRSRSGRRRWKRRGCSSVAKRLRSKRGRAKYRHKTKGRGVQMSLELTNCANLARLAMRKILTR